MPSYGQNLTPAEVTALVAFMQTLRPANQPPARTAIGPDTPGR
jgi:ubiquinol-cytochrome c reductase cytochrome b subunit